MRWIKVKHDKACYLNLNSVIRIEVDELYSADTEDEYAVFAVTKNLHEEIQWIVFSGSQEDCYDYLESLIRDLDILGETDAQTR